LLCSLISGGNSHSWHANISGFWGKLPPTINSKDYRAVANHVIQKLTATDAELGYQYNYHSTEIKDRSRVVGPQNFYGATVVKYKCSQLDVKRPSKPVLTLDLDHGLSFSQTRNRQSCPKFQCYGSLIVFFPPEGQDAFVFPNNPRADIAIRMIHIEQLGRTTRNGVPIPVREWITNNPRPSSQIQRDDLLRAIRDGKRSVYYRSVVGRFAQA
jgi:hypothetical protein